MSCPRNVPLLLLHGWGMQGGIWDDLVARLAPRQIFAPDLPGHGGTPMRVPYTLDRLAAYFLAQVPQVVDLCAWSLGGLIALEMARTAPQRIRRLVLVGSTPCFVARNDWSCGMPLAVFEGFAGALQQEYEPTLRRFLALQAQGDRAAREMLAVLRERLFARGRPEPRALQGGLDLLVQTDLRQKLDAVTMPTLVIQGGNDRLVPPCAGQWLASHLPDGRYREMPASGHAPFLSQTGVFVDMLREHLE